MHPDEVILRAISSAGVRTWRPCWSRYWLDLILSPRPIAKRRPFLRPWTAETIESEDVGWTGWENLHLKGPEATLWVTLPHARAGWWSARSPQDGSWVTLNVRPAESEQPLIATHEAAPGHAAFASFALPEPAHRIAIAASGECHVVFVGYED